MAFLKKLLSMVNGSGVNSAPRQMQPTQMQPTQPRLRTFEEIEAERKQRQAEIEKRRQENEKRMKELEIQAEIEARRRKKIAQKSADNVEKRTDVLPKNIGDAYVAARRYVVQGKYEEALKEFGRTQDLTLMELYKLKKIQTDGMSIGRMVHESDQYLKITIKQRNMLIELRNAIMRKGRYESMDVGQLFDMINQRIAPLLDILIDNMKKSSTGKSDANGKKKKNSSNKKDTQKQKTVKVKCFKDMERSTKAVVFNAREQYPDLNQYCQTAKIRAEEGALKESLNQVRNALELIVEELCRKFGCEFDERTSLETKIDMVRDSGDLPAEQIKLMHVTRGLGNKGSHHGTAQPTAGEASEAIEKLNKIISIFEKSTAGRVSDDNYILRGSNEYYDVERKYYGKWASCFSYGEIMINKEFLELKKKADDGDISAMLDIAVGFLFKPITWTRETLVYLKKYERYPDPCDARYYYWVLKACKTYYNNWQEGKSVPLRYLPTVLLEGIKFIKFHEMRYEEADVEIRRNDQFAYVEENLFGRFGGMSDLFKKRYGEMLIALMKEYDDADDLFAPVHRECSVEDVKALLK